VSAVSPTAKGGQVKTILVSAAVLLLAVSAALAEEAPKPAPELSQMKFFVGNWMCSGNAPASAFGPAHKSEATATAKWDLAGFWQSGTYAEKKTASNPTPIKGMFHITYDSKAKQFTMIWLDNFGTWSTETSPGWQGDTSVWTGDQMIMGEKTGSRDTFVRKSDTEYTHKYDLNTKGQWDLILEETCKKAGAAKPSAAKEGAAKK
jgi:hypothetical protein